MKLFNKKRVITSEKPVAKLTDRVFAVSFPTAVVLMSLVFMGKLEPTIAVMSFGAIILVTFIMMIPFLYDLQELTDFTKKISTDAPLPPQPVLDENDETGQIAMAITKMHNDWYEKHKKLKVRSISNAAVIDNLPTPLIMINNQKKIMNANKAARKVFGYNLKNIPLDKAVISHEILNAVDAILIDDNKTKSSSIPYKAEDSKKRPFDDMLVNIEQLPGEAEDGAVVVLAFHDVSPLNKLEKIQSDFVANASHELRTPLSVITGLTETIRGSAKDDPEAREKFIKIIEEQANKMTFLIEDLLAFSKINFEKKILLEENVNILDLVSNVATSLQQHAKNKNMSITINYNKEETVPNLKVNSKKIAQVFENILTNAIKYGFENTEIIISIKISSNIPDLNGYDFTSKNAVAIEFFNEGVGIPKKYLRRLTEKFYRIESAASHSIVGTGLGLSIVKEILKAHGGSLDIESEEGKNATFTVFLPVN